jgi:serine/threonine protein kinase
VAVAYAHARGVVHRNLVPWKVRIGAAGGAYLTGWGEARVLVEPEPPVPMTLVGPVAFVPAYVAPERVRGTRGDARTDVFGLGGLLCFLLTGRPPHPTDGGFVDAITRCLAGDFSDTFARLDACGADPRLVAVAKRCLAANPDHRYADAGEVAEAIAGCRHAAEESPAPPTPAPTPTEVVRAEPAPGGAEPTPAVAPPRRRWLVVAAVVAAALLVFGTALLRGR